MSVRFTPTSPLARSMYTLTVHCGWLDDPAAQAVPERYLATFPVELAFSGGVASALVSAAS